MCYPVPCLTCNKTTWKGCGMHIDTVKAGVAADQWCTCADDKRKPADLPKPE